MYVIIWAIFVMSKCNVQISLLGVARCFNTTVMLPKETAQALVELTGEARVDTALTRVIRDFARQKLMELETGLRQFEAKYGMSFETYRRLWESGDRPEHYTFEAENGSLHVGRAGHAAKPTYAKFCMAAMTTIQLLHELRHVCYDFRW